LGRTWRRRDSGAINFKPKSDLKPTGKQKKEPQTVDLAKLPEKTGPAVDFLREHVISVKGRVSAKGTKIQVEGLKHREVKLLLHKFLRHNGLDDHRVLSQSGILEIVPPHIASHPKLDKATTPSASATMPYLFPGTSAPVSTGKRRKKKA
jgi:hypothetical protein